MAQIVWDEIGSRVYQTGLDRGVLYLPDGSAVPWNGLVEVVEKTAKESLPVYYDGVKINDLVVPGPFAGNMKALTYPDEFTELEGLAAVSLGLYLGEQNSQVFGLSYRTRIGSDLDESLGYKIHILYNVSAVPTDRSNATNTENTNLAEFEWDISAIPEEATGFRPTAHVIIDSRYMDPAQLTEIENNLYGTEFSDGTLIPLIDFINYLYFGYRWKITDNGDGTWTANTPIEILLTYYGALTLPGVAGAYASTSDKASLDISGDIDLRVKLALVDWTPTGNPAYVPLSNLGGDVSGYELQITPGGQLSLVWGEAYTTYRSELSTVPVPSADNNEIWVRATLDVNDGSGNRVVRFYTSTDEGNTWNQLGSTVTTAGITSIAASTQTLRIGQRPADSFPIVGRVYAAEVRNGIDGVVVASPNFTLWAGETSFTDDEGNVWTINGTASIDVIEPDAFVLHDINASYLTPDVYQISDTLTDDP